MLLVLLVRQINRTSQKQLQPGGEQHNVVMETVLMMEGLAAHAGGGEVTSCPASWLGLQEEGGGEGGDRGGASDGLIPPSAVLVCLVVTFDLPLTLTLKSRALKGKLPESIFAEILVYRLLGL